MKSDENIKMEPIFKVTIKILPFGSLSYEISGSKPKIKEKKVKEMPIYVVPSTTNIENIDYESNTYQVPKSTAGL